MKAPRAFPKGYLHNHWELDVDQPFEAILDKNYWAEGDNKFKPHDKIDVIGPGGSYTATLFVIDVGRDTVVVDVEHHKSRDTTTDHRVDGYIVRWRGPQAKWSVMASDNESVRKDRFESKEAAHGWAAKNGAVI